MHKLISTALCCNQSGGNVLIPSDCAGRSLEILFVLHNFWEKERLGKDRYALCYLASNSKHSLELANTLTEYMNEKGVQVLFRLLFSFLFILSHVYKRTQKPSIFISFSIIHLPGQHRQREWIQCLFSYELFASTGDDGAVGSDSVRGDTAHF
jgi:Cft2 family RNA processing exonuclease